MFRRITIRNYRSIEAATVDLPSFAVLVGPNGSGKSNFADGIVFARDVEFDAATAIEKRGGIVGIRRWRKTKPYDVSVSIRASKTQDALETDFMEHSFTIHSKNEGNWNFSRESIEQRAGGKETLRVERQKDLIVEKPPKSFLPDSLPGTTSAMVYVRQMIPTAFRFALSNVRRIRLNPDVMRQPQIANERTRLDDDGSNIGTIVNHFVRHNRIEAIIEILGKIIPGLVEISAPPAGRYLALQFTQRQAGGQNAVFSATEMSDGAIRALGIVIAAQETSRDQLLIIEEPEVNVHAGAAALLFEVLKDASRRGSVLITTHSAELLDAAGEEEILVCDYRTGVTRIGPLAQEQRDVVRRGLFSVAELMRSEPLRIEGETAAAVGPADLP